MSCSGIRCRNKGSGYVKSEMGSESAKELEKRMEDLLKARTLQDAGIFAPVAKPAISLVSNNLNIAPSYTPSGGK